MESAKKRGRPRSHGPRVVTIQVRLTVEEDARFDAEAASLGVDKAELARRRIFQKDESDENIRVARIRAEEIASRVEAVERLLTDAASRSANTQKFVQGSYHAIKELQKSAKELDGKLSGLATANDIEKLGPPLAQIASASEKISRNIGNGR